MSVAKAWSKFEVHADGCDDCCWFTLQFCLVGRGLRDEYSRACALNRRPIGSVHRAMGKA